MSEEGYRKEHEKNVNQERQQLIEKVAIGDQLQVPVCQVTAGGELSDIDLQAQEQLLKRFHEENEARKLAAKKQSTSQDDVDSSIAHQHGNTHAPRLHVATSSKLQQLTQQSVSQQAKIEKLTQDLYALQEDKMNLTEQLQSEVQKMSHSQDQLSSMAAEMQRKTQEARRLQEENTLQVAEIARLQDA